ncbi:MAG TPA: tetratricopeptide repeat protein [Stellaceae bacterium]|nr:tetratricopeptide repeat protein [Stellaceae bacterium]
MRLGELLIGQGIATPADIETALKRQKREGGRLGTHLIAMGVLNVEQLLTMLRGQHEVNVAIDLCEQALQRLLTVCGPNHPNTYRARYNLARAFLAAGRQGDAREHAEWALAGHMTLLGREHTWTREAAQFVSDVGRAVARASQGAAEPAQPAAPEPVPAAVVNAA